MRDVSSRRGAFLPILVLAGFTLIQSAGRAQDVSRRAGEDASQVRTADRSDPRGEEASLRRLAQRLKHFRAIGDVEGAAQIFEQLFPPEPAGSPGAALKTGGVLPSSRIDGDDGIAKPVVAAEGAYPVFVSPKREKNPSAGISRSNGGAWTIFSAAEQWAGDRPGDIRVRKSSDLGLTWAETLLIGDGRASTHPALREVADDTIGVAYVKEWDDADGDIYFARLDGSMASSAEFPVALSLSDQSSPSLATDRQAYGSPYVYVVYAEREGASGAIKFRVSQDLGASWSRGRTIDSFSWPRGAAIETTLAFDPGENALHIAYTRPQGLSSGIATVTSTDFGASWSRPVFLTPFDHRPDSSPAIAAKGGTVIVVYEHGTGVSGGDIGLAWSTDSGRRWSVGASLAASAASEGCPDVQASEGAGMPRFFASYVEGNSRVRVMSAQGSAPGSWVAEGTFPDRDGLVALGSAIVLPMPSPDGRESAGILWAETSADEDIFFSPATVILNLAELVVTPGNQAVSYSQGTTSFSVTRTGDGQVDWTAAVTSGGTWLSIQSGASGTDAGTIVAAYAQNATSAERIGSIRVTPADIGVPSVTVTVTQEGAPVGTLSVTPDSGLTSTGFEGGPFTPSSQAYVLRNVGTTAISWRVAKVEVWTTLSATSGSLAAGASRTITVSINASAGALAAGTYNDTVSFMNTTNGNGNTTRPVTLAVSSSAGSLSVTPAEGLTSTGAVGGPFAPSSQGYTLHNPGATSIDWTASTTQTWTALSATAGALAAGASTTVTVSITSAADAFTAGVYGDTVTFTNTTNGSGNTTRAVTLTITPPPGSLTVTPAGGLTSTGPAGGPFTPSSQAYTLKNTGGTSLAWTAAASQTWVTVSPASGDLAGGASVTATVSINNWANALAEGAYTDSVVFTNTTNGMGNTSRPVALTVAAGPTLAVAPADRDVTFPAGTTTFAVSNAGGGILTWTASVIAGGGWLTIASGASGTDSGTITVTFTENRTSAERVGLIRVAASGAAGSPKDVTVTQASGTITLSLTAQRLVEKAWIIQREYGGLTVSIGNPAAIPIDHYVIYRKVGSGDFQVLATVSGSSIEGAQFAYADTFLEPGTSYTYKALAYDALGTAIVGSNEVTI